MNDLLVLFVGVCGMAVPVLTMLAVNTYEDARARRLRARAAARARARARQPYMEYWDDEAID